MNVLEIILAFYILPMVVNLTYHYFDKGVSTVGDFLEIWHLFLIPVVNLIVMFCIPIIELSIRVDWKKIKNKKIKIIILILSSFLLFSCGNVEQRIKEHSYTEKWYNIDTLSFQVYKTKSGREYIIILNERETRFKRKYIN